MGGDVTLRSSITRGYDVRQVLLAATVLLVASSVSAADLGRAEGALTIDKDRIGLGYAYAIGHQRNDTTKRKDETKVILTDKALPQDANLDEIEATIPDNTYAMIFNIAPNGKVTHVAVLHPKGSYDAGFLEDMPDYRFKNAGGSRGIVAGKISSGRIQTNTMAFTVDADFNAAVK